MELFLAADNVQIPPARTLGLRLAAQVELTRILQRPVQLDGDQNTRNVHGQRYDDHRSRHHPGNIDLDRTYVVPPTCGNVTGGVPEGGGGTTLLKNCIFYPDRQEIVFSLLHEQLFVFATSNRDKGC